MKQLITILLTVFSISQIHSQGNINTDQLKKRYEFLKERNISRTFPAAANSLIVENSFGDITISTWNKNEIKIDIHIVASSSQEDATERIFKNLDVEETKNGTVIKFKTITEKGIDKNYHCKNCKSSMEISYKIYLPESLPLKIHNSFGKINIPDYNGTLSIESKFCEIEAGILSKVEKLNVEFGNKAHFKGLNAINATFKFAPVTIESLSGNSTIKMEFCNGSRIMLDNNLSSLTLNQSYGSLNIRPASNLSASYRIRTSFGSFRDRSNANIQRTDKPDEYGPDSERTFEGKSGSGAAKIEIKSSFGKIIIGEATAEEMEDKKKNKATAEI